MRQIHPVCFVLLAMAIALCGGVVLPASAHPQVQNRQSRGVGNGDAVPPMDSCIDQFFDDSGSTNLHNHCTVYLTVLFSEGSSPYASVVELGADQKFSTGYTSDDIEHRGAIKYAACPGDHPSFRDYKGNRLTVPGVAYVCEKATY
jgi:hypothetical protein